MVEMEFKIEFDDPKQAMIVHNSLKPELLSSPSNRASVDLKLDGRNLDINIQAEDTTSLRAAVNSYIRWINLSLDVLGL